MDVEIYCSCLASQCPTLLLTFFLIALKLNFRQRSATLIRSKKVSLVFVRKRENRAVQL